MFLVGVSWKSATVLCGAFYFRICKRLDALVIFEILILA